MKRFPAGIVLLGGEYVGVFELGVPSKVGGETWVVQLVWAVEPLVGEPGLGLCGSSLDPLVVSDAWGQIVQELELRRVDEHDPPVLLSREDSWLICKLRDKVLANEFEIVVARVKANHWHLVEPFQDTLTLLFRDAVNVWKPELVYHIHSDSLVPPLQGLVEEMYQLAGILGDNVLGLWVQGVRNGYGNGYVLAFIREISRGKRCLGFVLVRFKVVHNRVGISFIPLWWATIVPPGARRFMRPPFHHCITSCSQKLSSSHSPLVGNLPCNWIALAVVTQYFVSLVGKAFLAPMPEAAVELKDGFRLGVITIHRRAQNVSLASMTTPCVMNVDAPPLCLPLDPGHSLEAESDIGVKGFLVS